MRPVEVVEILPLLKLVIEYLGIVDDDPVKHPVELLIVDPMGPFDFAVESGSCGFDIDVVDATIQHVIVELGHDVGHSPPLSVWIASTRNGNCARR